MKKIIEKQNNRMKKAQYYIIYAMVIAYMVLAFVSLTSCSGDDIDDGNAIINTVYILDLNFEQSLIDLGIDTNGLNGNILKSDAEAVTNLELNEKNIISLQGIEAFTNLESLFCVSNHLTSIDVSNNLNLETLYCFNNEIKHLDVSNNSNLKVLSCGSNKLEFLNVKNGNNINMEYFNTVYNPYLNCIEVDDYAYSNNNWIHIDAQTSFSEDCN